MKKKEQDEAMVNESKDARKNNTLSGSMDEEEILRAYLERKEKLPQVIQYEKETKNYAIWGGKLTEEFKKWLKGEKVNSKEKERISFYVSKGMKREWTEFAREHGYSTISKFIRQTINNFIEHEESLPGGWDEGTLKKFSHALKQPLTSIKGYSQLLLEEYNEVLNNEVSNTIWNIFQQSLLLENIINSFFDDMKSVRNQIDILLIEDDLATIRLLRSYFQSKGISLKGVVSGSKAIEVLKQTRPRVILLDIILPDLSGYDICKTIKMDKRYKGIPVYYLTAIARNEVIKHLEETDANGYILKPFDFADFEEILKYLEKQKHDAQENSGNQNNLNENKDKMIVNKEQSRE
ncbi:MAG: response regulator [Promethearchaeota archaeon]